MEYLLVVTTHGKGDTLKQTLDSFEQHVTPAPTDRVLIEDGGCPMQPVEWWTARRIGLGYEEQGYCDAVAAGWDEIRASPLPWVFWLEHDFLFTQHVDLRDLAHVLKKHRHSLAQMSLVRQAVNRDEIERGGVLAGLPHAQVSDFLSGSQWIEHDVYWTTNPSLFLTEIAHEHEWPAGPECEGKFGIELREQGYSFAAWGWGEQYVEHIGKRSGKGY